MKLSRLAAFAAILAVSAGPALAAKEYTFKVHNKTSQKIVGLLVSQDGKGWKPFNLGDGIAAGAEVTMKWDESTNNESCEQQVKALYADKSESEPASFDFCEDDLELEFEE